MNELELREEIERISEELVKISIHITATFKHSSARAAKEILSELKKEKASLNERLSLLNLALVSYYIPYN